MNLVSKNIKHLRKKNTMSQEALAEKLHVTRQAVSNWETGKTQPDIDTLLLIAMTYGVDITEVIYGEKRDITIQRDNKKYRLPAIIFGVITLIFILLEIFLVPFFKELASTRFIGNPKMIYLLFFRPVLFMCVPVAFFSTLSLAFNIGLNSKTVRTSVTTASLIVMVIYYYTVANSFFSLFPLPLPIVSFFIFTLSDNPFLFLLPGTALFFGINK